MMKDERFEVAPGCYILSSAGVSRSGDGMRFVAERLRKDAEQKAVRANRCIEHTEEKS